MSKKTEDIFKRVKKYIIQQHMICDNDVIFAGVSGGADSICLLFMLWELSKEINFRLIVVHVHHGVRKEADDDAAYVEALCSRLNIPFYIRKVDMTGYAKKMGLSPEEAGRRLRYQAYEDIIEEVSGSSADMHVCKIAVAHNKNDKAETLLFNLFRGSGLRGLGSIRPVRGSIIRPLLCLERSEIEFYLEQKEILFCIDSTNEDDTYTRNRIRHHILPFAEEQICKNSIAHISDTADILAESEIYIQKQARLAFERCTHYQETAFCEEKEVNRFNKLSEDTGRDEVILDLKAFFAEDTYLQKMILLYCMEHLTYHRKDITREHITALSELCAKGGSKELCLPYGLMAYKEYDRIVICKKIRNKPKDVGECENNSDISVNVPGQILVPGLGRLEFKYLKKDEFFCKKGQIIPEKTYTKWFDYDKITRVLVLRTRKSGDYLTIDAALRKKTLKEYMINEKIPQIKRDSIYMLADGAHILWIPGYRISHYYKVDENTKNILQVHLEEEDNG